MNGSTSCTDSLPRPILETSDQDQLGVWFLLFADPVNEYYIPIFLVVWECWETNE